MTVSRPCYVAREAVKVALELASPSYDDAVDLAIAQASDKIDGQLRRTFYPTYDTRYFDYPNDQLANTGELWLEEDEVTEVLSLSSGGQVISPANYFLYSTSPFDRISLNRSSSSSFTTGNTYQNNIAVTGTFGYTDAEKFATTLTVAINTSVTLATITNGATVGVGQLIRVGSERMLVTGKKLVNSGQTSLVELDQMASQTIIPVTDGTAFNAGEEIYIDGESMTILMVKGNDLIVKRSTTWLEGHLINSPIYVARQLELIRAATGTTAGSAGIAAEVYVLTPPSLIQQLCMAEAVTTYLQTDTGYARSLGSGSSDGKPSGAGLDELWKAAKATFKRYLTGAV